MQVIDAAGTFAGPPGQVWWAEHLRVEALSVGTYCIPAGGTDDQEPHTEDEVYLVTAGRATLESGDAAVTVRPGSVIYLPAGEVHRFTHVTEDLAVVVLFAPAEYSRQG